MKRWFAILAAVVLTMALCLTLTGCATIERSEVVGKWEELYIEGGVGYVSNSGSSGNTYYVKVVFDEDGTFEMELPHYSKLTGTWKMSQTNRNIVEVFFDRESGPYGSAEAWRFQYLNDHWKLNTGVWDGLS